MELAVYTNFCTARHIILNLLFWTAKVFYLARMHSVQESVHFAFLQIIDSLFTATAVLKGTVLFSLVPTIYLIFKAVKTQAFHLFF